MVPNVAQDENAGPTSLPVVPNGAQDESAGCVISGRQQNGGPGPGDVEMSGELW